jgi:hypothetical protein
MWMTRVCVVGAGLLDSHCRHHTPREGLPEHPEIYIASALTDKRADSIHYGVITQAHSPNVWALVVEWVTLSQQS